MNNRIDYLVIWGHGLNHVDAIREQLRNHPHFEVVKIHYHKPKSMSRLVSTVYSYDYAPFGHLRAKTNYLKKTPCEVAFIFFKNDLPKVDYMGEGAFRHLESTTLKKFKDELRDKFNPYIDGKRTEDHVIHASDNEKQTDYILQYLGFKKGLKTFYPPTNYLSTPYYLERFQHTQILTVSLTELYCSTCIGKDKYNYSTKCIPLASSPQYLALSKGAKIYEDYLSKFIGGPLTEDYSIESYLELAKNLMYPNSEYPNNYIIAQRQDDKLTIIDGLHRAAILLFRGHKTAIVGVVKNEY